MIDLFIKSGDGSIPKFHAQPDNWRKTQTLPPLNHFRKPLWKILHGAVRAYYGLLQSSSVMVNHTHNLIPIPLTKIQQRLRYVYYGSESTLFERSEFIQSLDMQLADNPAENVIETASFQSFLMSNREFTCLFQDNNVFRLLTTTPQLVFYILQRRTPHQIFPDFQMPPPKTSAEYRYRFHRYTNTYFQIHILL